MTYRIIGTAGHIDHGKTALIQALTGRDTDRLEEEKRRGISIDLGFTYFELPDKSRAGVVDVPGHERFLPNMLSGAGGMDLVLLVIALDEGIMPQTREHMDILELLEMPEGIVVLTKEDCVDTEWADMAEEEIREELADTWFADWPMLRVSAITGAGIPALREKILEKLKTQGRFHEGDEFRLPIDRVIPLKGLGTAAAGTILEGNVRAEDEIMLYPDEKKVRIKGIQVHGEARTEAAAGQRTSLLLGGADREELRRGQVLASCGSLYPSDRLDVRLRMVQGTKRVLKNRARLHLHVGTDQLICRAVLFGTDQLSAGENCFAQLLLESPAAVRWGDCFVIRFFSPLETIGGGKILDACPPQHKRSDASVLQRLILREEQRFGELVCLELEKKEGPVLRQELLKCLGAGEKKGCAVLEELEKTAQTASLYVSPTVSFWQTADWWENRRRDLCAELNAYHEKWPFRQGMERTALKESIARRWEAGSFEAWLKKLEAGHIVEQRGIHVSIGGFQTKENAQTTKLLQSLTKAFEDAGYDFCSLGDLCPPDMDRGLYWEILEFLAKKGRIVKISEDFCTTPALAKKMKCMAECCLKEKGEMDIAALRDLLQTTRRSAKPAMEYLQQCGVVPERNDNTGR